LYIDVVNVIRVSAARSDSQQSFCIWWFWLRCLYSTAVNRFTDVPFLC